MLDQLAQFLGRFHLVVLHVPIGTLIALALVEAYAAWQRTSDTASLAWLLAILGSASAIATVALGIFLSWGGSYDPDILFRHKWLGVTTAVLSVGLVALKFEVGRGAIPQTTRLYQTVLATCLVTLIAGGHNGGTLTHGAGFLTRYAPFGSSDVPGAGTPLGSDDPFALTVQPVFETHCLECHGPEKQEHGLRLDERASILEGGESGKPAAVPGDAMASEMVRRLTLARSHDEAMPPEGHSRPSAEEILALIAWINDGAPLGDALTGLEQGIEPAPNALLDDLRALDIDVRRLSEQHVLLSVSLEHARQATSGEQGEHDEHDELVPRLGDIAPQIAWLNLARRTLTEAGWSTLGRYERLTRLHLERTNVEDRHLATVGTLSHLEYLNLHGTGITDKGLEHLAGLADLETLYVWGTQVTPDGAARLAASLPSARIHLDSSTPSWSEP